MVPLGKEDRSRKAQQLGHPILQIQGSRIEPSLFVAYDRAGDGLAHPGGRSRLRVAIEIDRRQDAQRSAELQRAPDDPEPIDQPRHILG